MTAQAESDDFEYEENESGITITDYWGDETEIAIPGEIDGKKVTAIGDRAFLKCYSLTSITLPEGLLAIDEGAFSDCSRLRSITIPKNVTSINDMAF